MSAAEAFLNRVLDTAFDISGMQADVVNVQWVAGLAIAARALRQASPFTRERLLRGVEEELRADLVGIERIARRGRVFGPVLPLPPDFPDERSS